MICYFYAQTFLRHPLPSEQCPNCLIWLREPFPERLHLSLCSPVSSHLQFLPSSVSPSQTELLLVPRIPRALSCLGTIDLYAQLPLLQHSSTSSLLTFYSADLSRLSLENTSFRALSLMLPRLGQVPFCCSHKTPSTYFCNLVYHGVTACYPPPYTQL